MIPHPAKAILSYAIQIQTKSQKDHIFNAWKLWLFRPKNQLEKKCGWSVKNRTFEIVSFNIKITCIFKYTQAYFQIQSIWIYIYRATGWTSFNLSKLTRNHTRNSIAESRHSIHLKYIRNKSSIFIIKILQRTMKRNHCHYSTRACYITLGVFLISMVNCNAT